MIAASEMADVRIQRRCEHRCITACVQTWWSSLYIFEFTMPWRTATMAILHEESWDLWKYFPSRERRPAWLGELLGHGVPPAVCNAVYLCTLVRELPDCFDRRLDAVEFFAGMKSITTGLQNLGFVCLAIDKEYADPWMDILTDKGFAMAICLCMQARRVICPINMFIQGSAYFLSIACYQLTKLTKLTNLPTYQTYQITKYAQQHITT
jgi:hypothetical protein